MKKNWILGISSAIAGLLLLIAPAFCIKLVVVLFGLTLVIEGFYGTITERKLFENESFQRTTLYKSIGSIIVGILSIAMPLAVAGTAWKVMTYVLAFYLILAACAGFYASSKLKDINSSEVPDRKNLTLENVITIAAAIILLIIGPEKLGVTIVRIVGIVAFIIGALCITMQILEKKNVISPAEYEVKDED